MEIARSGSAIDRHYGAAACEKTPQFAHFPEIDGLRAVAVAAVVLYHAGLGSAGYVGVDMFFVISGYLITSLLLRELRINGAIDFRSFYARRVRRILPAALAVILAVVIASACLLGAQELDAVARSGAASAAFLANLHFEARTGGYFAGSSEQMPLLHLWSLSVEEQFYLCWPLIIGLISLRYLRPVLALVIAASFVWCEWQLASDPTAAFFQAPSRAWELAAGGLVATGPRRTLPKYSFGVGVAGIFMSCVVPVSHFPGIGAIPIVAFTCLALTGIHGGASNRLLSSAPFVWLGLVSYSLYLWHWPLLALHAASTVGPTPIAERLGLCVLALVVAVGSYAWIEQPFRKLTLGAGKWIVVGGLASIFTMGAALFASHSAAGSLLADTPREVKASLIERDVLPEPRAPTVVDVAIWGDSYAHSWQPLAWAFANGQQDRALTMSSPGCPPLLGFPLESHRTDECASHNASALARVRGARVVILAFNWQRYSTGARETKDVEDALRRTIAALAPRAGRVVVLAPTPVLVDALPKCVRLGRNCSIDRQAFESSAGPLRAAMMRAMDGYANVSAIDASDYLCTPQECSGFRRGIALYSDDSHVTASAARSGSRWLLQR